ncbi:MAG: hypothetical protein SVR04_11040 [Spirochaetota bacterium]|nr:hypothetical protein [Spirochaetota bacterium]
MKHRTTVLSILWLLLTAWYAAAFEPTFSLEGYGRADLYSGDGELYGTAGVSAEAGQRNLFDRGYWSWYAAGNIERYLDGLQKTVDSEQLAADLRLTRGHYAIDVSSTLDLSASSLQNGSTIEPGWSGSLLYLPVSSPFFANIDYKGYWVYQELNNDDRLSHDLSLTAGWDYSLRLGLFLTAGAAFSEYSDYYLLDAANQETSSQRSDRRFYGELGFEGLAGYFTDWEGVLYGEYTDSNANRWISGSSSLENESEDSWAAGAEWGLNWSPSRTTQYEIEAFLDYREYLHRTALDSSEISTGEQLTVTKTGASLNTSWTDDNTLFWNLNITVFRSFSRDPEFNTWNFGLQAGVEYTF